MTILSLQNLGIILGASLFEGLSLSLQRGDRLGLVAANGRGKSTLLRAIASQVPATVGEVTRARGLKVGLVTQDVPPDLLPIPLREAVLGALPPEERETDGWRADIVLDDLHIPSDLHNRPLSSLSGGWQRVALLARAWVDAPDLLLLDEPTNHLDLGRIGFLQRWLMSTAGTTLIIASHDRAFLDAVTNRTLFLRAARSQVFALPFQRARLALAEADEADARRFENEMKQAQQLRKQAAKLQNIGINSGSDLLVVKTRQLKARAERMEAAARPAHAERSAGAIRLGNSGTHAKALVTLEDVPVTAPDGRLLFRTGRLWLEKGDRVALLGPNGAGKSRLVRMIAAALTAPADASPIKMAASLMPGHSDQNLSQLDADPTPLAAITRRFDLGDQKARTVLAGAGLGIDLQQAKMSALSGGQKARLAMLVLRLTNPNFYLLDEPTNHLDIEGQEALEAELCAHEASCLLVSHDRDFVRNTCTRFWQIEGKRLVEVEGPEPFFARALAG